MMLRSLLLAMMLAVAARAESLVRPGPEIRTPGETTAWAPLLRRLAARSPIQSTFTERRWFFFRREPVVLEGELRFSRTLGLSLHYTRPTDHTLIIDRSGMVMRDAKGHDRVPPSDNHVAELAESMLAIMRFDLHSLMTEFVLHAARSDGTWRIDLTPRAKQERRILQDITVFGAGDEVTRLIFEHSRRERVEVDITESHTLPAFSAADLKRYFR